MHLCACMHVQYFCVRRYISHTGMIILYLYLSRLLDIIAGTGGIRDREPLATGCLSFKISLNRVENDLI